jgi:oligopeptide/dipeptide ABC transporter ATP-binding protein
MQNGGSELTAVGQAYELPRPSKVRGDDADGSIPSETLLRVEHLQVTIPTRGRRIAAVRDVSFEIERGKTFVLVGESGSGKSVTAKTILGMIPTPTTQVGGSVLFKGTQLVGLSQKDWRHVRGTGISIVFQDPMRSLNPTMKIGKQISEGMTKHLGMNKTQAEDHAAELLSLVGIPSPRERLRDYPHQLSGGMRQRVMMAIAISCNPEVLIADEPTTALDVTTEAQIMELLMKLQDELNMGLLLITHDMGLAFTYADEIAVMYAGRIVERAPSTVLFDDARMPYTHGLLASVPSITAEPHSDFESMPGRPPDASVDIVGCAFEPRCEYSQPECKEVLPELEGSEHHQWRCLFPLGGND